MIGNKASVGGSICEAYLLMESTQLFSHYFEPHVMSQNHNVDHNDDGGVPFVSMYLQHLEEEFLNLSQSEIDESLEENFAIWFKGYARCNPIENEYLCSLARGPLIGSTSHSVYFVNGYKFHIECHGRMRSTMNSGVYISDPNFGDYYGRIKEIIQVEYCEAPLKQTVLFKCEWFDPTIDVGVKKHDRYKLVEINHRRRYKKYEPFILAMQATQVFEEVEVHEIDMFVSVDEDIPLNDPNGGVLKMNEPLNDGLFEEHHEIQDGSIEEEYETEETEEEDEEEEFEEDIDSGYRASKSTGRSKAANRAKIPSIPALVIEQDDTSSIPTMPPDQTPVIPETSPISPNQSSPTGQNMNAQSNTIAEATSSQRNVSASSDSSCNNARTLIFLTSLGLEPSSKYSSSITLSFKSEVDPNGINWKGVSQDVKDGYFGEFKKNFYWDASVSEFVVKQQWMKKVALCYKNFISNIKNHRATVQPEFVNDHVWEKCMKLCQSDDCVKNFEINSKNRCGGQEVAVGTHTGGSITAGEHRKKLIKALKIGRDPTPSELHLYVHTHNHDEKSFVGERSRLLHERYEEIVREKVQCESEIDQLETYYEAVGGAKKKRLFGLGSEAASYFGKKLCTYNASTLSVPLLISIPTTNMKEFVKQLISALTTHFLPIVIECVGGIRVQEGAVLDPPPNNDDDDNVDS
ncbi:hypothetical protein P3L10_015170 [Capsicum annuum]